MRGFLEKIAPNASVSRDRSRVNRDAVQLELLTVDVTTPGDGQDIRYRAELNVLQGPTHRFNP